jgi:hypothetical protein
MGPSTPQYQQELQHQNFGSWEQTHTLTGNIMGTAPAAVLQCPKRRLDGSSSSSRAAGSGRELWLGALQHQQWSGETGGGLPACRRRQAPRRCSAGGASCQCAAAPGIAVRPCNKHHYIQHHWCSAASLPCTVCLPSNSAVVCPAHAPLTCPAILCTALLQTLLGQVDLAFLAAYAIGMFFAGHMGDRTDLRVFLATGMVGSGLFCMLFGMVSEGTEGGSTAACGCIPGGLAHTAQGSCACRRCHHS